MLSLEAINDVVGNVPGIVRLYQVAIDERQQEIVDSIYSHLAYEGNVGLVVHNVPWDNFGQTLLHWAARNGEDSIVELLRNGPEVQVNEGDNIGGSTPLHLAAEFGHLRVIQLLLLCPWLEVNAVDKSGRTPLLRALDQGHSAAFELLLEDGRTEINAADDRGTALHRVAARGDIRLFKN
ncbi:Ankyrin repeat domain-containing protein [Plasmodiophora brassicae]|uniref:Uncharacterized protein n=1 Tax=Plasmodiophora brassicae TaxID=37360 RepID=A0A0G4J6L9_PLABS|nr:hypothetical protein PBRA_009257 [Plasmodiophora brassicae]